MFNRWLLVSAMIISFCASAVSQDVTFDQFPRNLQLFPRAVGDSALVPISGKVSATGYDSLKLHIYRDAELWKVESQSLNYSADSALFSFQTAISAGMHEYQFKIYLDQALVATCDSIVCGDVYFINGQSNALAIDYEGLATYRSEWLRSFGSSSQVPAQAGADVEWGLAQGHEYATHAAVGVWGIELGRLLVETHGIPVCILSGATGGSYIADHLKNNSQPTNLNTNYGKLLFRAQQAEVQNGVKAIFWYQGEMNTDITYSTYAIIFRQLYNSWKADFRGLEKIYLFQIRPTEGDKYQSQLRETQRQLSEQYADVEIMSTCGIPGHDGLHYNFLGYRTVAKRIFPLVSRDFYQSTDTLHITPPNIIGAYYTSDAQDELAITFDQEILWPADTAGYSLKDYIFLGGGNTVTIDSGYTVEGNVLMLHLSEQSTATHVSYLPPKYYTNTYKIYQGPWLKNPRGITALSFFAYPIAFVDVSESPVSSAVPEHVKLFGNYPNPFNASTIISYELYRAGNVELSIYNSTGQLVSVLLNDDQSAGFYHHPWRPSDLPSGMYLFGLRWNGGIEEVRRMILLK